MNSEIYKLYAVTDRNLSKNFFGELEEAVKAGVTLVQLREKNLAYDEFTELAKQVKKLLAKYNVPLIINDNIDVAIAVDADGVHLGQSDMKPEQARKILGKNKIIGVSARTIEQAQTAYKNGADYIGSGAVFGTSTKKDAKKLSLEEFSSVCKSVPIPVVAIGGVTAENIEQLEGTGASGVAVVSAIFGQPDITEAVNSILNIANKIF